MTLPIGVLVSGSGSNLGAILEAIQEKRLDASCRVVISNRPGVLALERAARFGVPSRVIDHKAFSGRETFEAEVLRELRARGVEWLVLAGFMRVLSPLLLDAYQGRVINIHPSLLPAFPGVDAQAQAHAHGVKVTGCTVHFVDNGVDSGPIVAQATVPVFHTDSAEDVRARILKEEHRLLPLTLDWIARGKVRLVKRPGARSIVEVDESLPGTGSPGVEVLGE